MFTLYISFLMAHLISFVVKGFSSFVGMIFGHAIELSFLNVLAKYYEISFIFSLLLAIYVPSLFFTNTVLSVFLLISFMARCMRLLSSLLLFISLIVLRNLFSLFRVLLFFG